MSTNLNPNTWRLRTPGGIPFKVLDREGVFGAEDSNATETYIIQAGRLLDFIMEGFPLPIIFNGNVLYPRGTSMGGMAPLTVKQIAWSGLVDGLPSDPFGTDTNAPNGTYQDYIKVKVSYGTAPENDTASDPNEPWTFLEISSTASGEFLASPIRGSGPSGAFWHSDDPFETPKEVTEIDVAKHVDQSLVEWSLRWARIPYGWFNSTLNARLRAAMGKVNDSVMPIFGDAPAETILFIGYSMSNQYTWRSGYAGASPIALDLKFLEKNFLSEELDLIFNPITIQVTHNYVYRPGWGWRKLVVNNNNLFSSCDLNSIFSP